MPLRLRKQRQRGVLASPTLSLPQHHIIKDIKKHSFYLKPGDKRWGDKHWHGSVRARR